MKDLKRYVISRYASEWHDIGLELGIQDCILVTIEKDNPTSNAKCFEQTLRKWLQLSHCTTWKTLELAITNVRRYSLGLDPVKYLLCEGTKQYSIYAKSCTCLYCNHLSNQSNLQTEVDSIF